MEGLEKNKKRIDWIDFAKGIGAFLVVLGHVKTLNHDIILMIYSFHMPLFFILSGYTFKNKPKFFVHLKSKFKGLLIPYIFAAGVDVIRVIIRNLTGFSNVSAKDILTKTIFLNSEPLINYPIWFLVVLFEVEVVYYFLFRLNTISKISILIAAIALSAYFDTAFYFGLGIALRALIFFIIGDLLKNVDFSAIKKKYLLCLIAALVVMLPLWSKAAVDNKFVNLLRLVSGESYFTYLFCALYGSLAVIAVSALIGKLPVINYLGKQSLYLLIFQNWFWSLYINAILPAVKNQKLLDFLNSKVKGALFIALCITVCCVIIAFPISKHKEKKKRRRAVSLA